MKKYYSVVQKTNWILYAGRLMQGICNQSLVGKKMSRVNTKKLKLFCWLNIPST